MTKRVVVTDHVFGDVGCEEAMAATHEASFAVYSCQNSEETIQAVDGADVAMVSFAPMTRKVLSHLKTGATVIRYGVGYDNVDIEAAAELGISVANVPDYGVETVADHTVATLLASLRRLSVYDQTIKRNGWAEPTSVGPLKGFRSTVIGLIGLGRIAQAVHRRLEPFGFKFIAFDPYCPSNVFDRLGIERVGLDELAQRADAVTLHAPSTTENRNLIGEEFLSRVQPGITIINTARGALVDLQALTRALDDGRVAAAALDVTDPEPLPLDSPLRHYRQVSLTPHAAFYDTDSLANLQRLASEEAARALTGQPLRCRIV